MTYRQALRYLDSFINYEAKDDYNYKDSFSLDRMARLASLLGDPQESVRSVHIAGTKGKGSTCAMVQSILKHAGFNVGLYTSPHLSSFTERIRINDRLISERDVACFLGKVKSAVDRMKDDIPSFFEVYTAVAFLYFKEKKVDYAVYEVGLGGRLDATNIVEPLVSVITPISYEHTDKLGHTLGQIASEKAGIIKKDSVCVVAPQEKEALDAIKNIAEQKNTRLIIIGRDVHFKEMRSDESGEVFAVRGSLAIYPRLATSLIGAHQIANASGAIAAIEVLISKGAIVPKSAIVRGLKYVKWPGRLEIVSKRPYIVLDGAQNRASAHVLKNAVNKIFNYKKLILVLGVSGDKDIKGILRELLPISDKVILTKSRMVNRAMDPAKIIKFIAKSKDVRLTANVSEALRMAKAGARPSDMILVTGSLFVVGEAREL
jgi:dihydrofolate synthase/folylpolyglutamate synthase